MKKTINNKISRILVEFKHQLLEIYGDRLYNMTLYGSNARGDAEPGSDIDILVVLSGEVKPIKEIARTEYVVSEVSLKYNVVITCVFVSEERYKRSRIPLLMNIHKEGITI